MRVRTKSLWTTLEIDENAGQRHISRLEVDGHDGATSEVVRPICGLGAAGRVLAQCASTRLRVARLVVGQVGPSLKLLDSSTCSDPPRATQRLEARGPVVMSGDVGQPGDRRTAPTPLQPRCRGVPIDYRTGRAVANASSAPPTMKVSLASVAAATLPETRCVQGGAGGGNGVREPAGGRGGDSAHADHDRAGPHSGEGPPTAGAGDGDDVAVGEHRQEMMSAPSAASTGLLAARAPYSAANVSAFSPDLFQAVT